MPYSYGGDNLQIRQDAGSSSPGTINGTVIVYGDVAPTPYGGAGPERMVRGVWGRDVETQPWGCNVMHNHLKDLGSTRTGELRLTDSSTALSAELVLNDDEHGRECAMLARRGVLKGLSSEFDIVTQLMGADGVRDVVRAAGVGLAVVNRPAYGKSQLSIRQAQAESTIIAGPAGAGKSQRARVLLRELRDAGLQPFAADVQSLLAALLLLERLPDGRYPERLDDQQYALAMVGYLRTTLIRQALENDQPTIATISEKPGSTRYTSLLALFGGQAKEEIIDPGIDVIVERLSGPDGTISDQCAEAADRYYGPGSIREYIDNRSAENRRRRRMVV